MTTPTLTITDFLLARIAEDEAAARSAQLELDRPWVEWCDLIWRKWAEVDAGADHAERHDPARVLADCKVKWGIVYLLDSNETLTAKRGGYTVTADARGMLRLLASAYADHPDFRPEWRP